MSATHKLLALLIALSLSLSVFFVHSWLRAHDEYIRAEAQLKADQSAFAQLARQQSDLATQLKQTQLDQRSQLATLNKQFAQTQSPDQLAALISNVMKLPQPIRIVTPPSTIENPHPDPIAQVPLPDAPQAKAFVQACQECQIRLFAAEKQADLTAQRTETIKQELALTQNERDTWKRTAQGGSWPRRAVKRAAAFALDAGITVVVACASHHCK
jgi:hypothetical protein